MDPQPSDISIAFTRNLIGKTHLSQISEMCEFFRNKKREMDDGNAIKKNSAQNVEKLCLTLN